LSAFALPELLFCSERVLARFGRCDWQSRPWMATAGSWWVRWSS